MAKALSTIGYSLNVDMLDAIERIRRSGVKRIGIQAPEGLKRALPEIAKEISENTGVDVIVSGDPCFGACDIDLALCDEVDLFFHLGHSELGESSAKIIYLEARMEVDINEAVEKAVPYLKSKRVGLATTVQHVHKLAQALGVLKDHEIEGFIGSALCRVKYPGQVLGCCYCSARYVEADEILFIGTGKFHPLGIALATGKRVVATDPITCEVSLIDPDPILRQRFGTITRAKRATKFAILVSKKPGQRRWQLAIHIKELGNAAGRKMVLIYLDNIEPDRLLNLGIEAAVSTACPRVALDDAAKYKIPILTPSEFEILLGLRQWEDYTFDEII
ncbi:MAG: diphthamide biosynthesis enzyme Dph2 [Methanotrichaceae archaeon]|nr:diphthamide biosynthesis enzyme Dph2 [Methanotrichaceae archaeon]